MCYVPWGDEGWCCGCRRSPLSLSLCLCASQSTRVAFHCSLRPHHHPTCADLAPPSSRVLLYHLNPPTPTHTHPFRAPSKVRERVADLLRGRVVVGHAVHNDFKALQLTHPPHLTRDTACYPPLMTDPASEGKEGKPRPRSLRALSEEVLGLSIQSGSHSPVEDARCGE